MLQCTQLANSSIFAFVAEPVSILHQFNLSLIDQYFVFILLIILELSRFLLHKYYSPQYLCSSYSCRILALFGIWLNFLFQINLTCVAYTNLIALFLKTRLRLPWHVESRTWAYVLVRWSFCALACHMGIWAYGINGDVKFCMYIQRTCPSDNATEFQNVCVVYVWRRQSRDQSGLVTIFGGW